MRGIQSWLLLVVSFSSICFAQQPPYDVYPDVEPPYYRVRYEASDNPGELIFPVKYALWIPPGVDVLRGVIVHQHGCGEGSCKSGLTGAFDLHWQALARKHDCALLAPSYEQPQEGNCQMWCDPRNGSGKAFQKGLVDLGEMSGHPELAEVPLALWGHSGGGHWSGGMVLLHPDRVAAAWLRSGVPLLTPNPDRPEIKSYAVPDAALKVPVMCNPGTKEGVTNKEGRFARVWPAVQDFFYGVRGKGGLVGVAVDPLTSHECGNQRYLAIPWLDTCLSMRLPASQGAPLRDISSEDVWLAEPKGTLARSKSEFSGDPLQASWLPSKAIAQRWTEYVKDTKVSDLTPPDSPTDVKLADGVLTWSATADLESGIAHFIITRDGEELGIADGAGKNRFGRPLFQGLQYSDTPLQPLISMAFPVEEEGGGVSHSYQVITVNTMGLKSEPSQKAISER